MQLANRYELTRLLEHGRFGALYPGVDLRRAAAGEPADLSVWVLPAELAGHGAALAAVKRDVERIRHLAHPNIARVHDVGQDGDRFFVTAELANGETLRSVLDALAPDRLATSEADAVIEQLGSALAYAHERGIVHGDVRPENVIVTDSTEVKLANFIHASLARSTTLAPAPVGDTRALAALAHEMYSGAAPGRAARSPSSGAIPRRRHRAIAAALAASSAARLSVVEFLAQAGLTLDGYPPRRRPTPADSMPPGPSSWRYALPLAGLAAIGAAFYAGDTVVGWPRAWLETARTAADDAARAVAAWRPPAPERTPADAGATEPSPPAATPSSADAADAQRAPAAAPTSAESHLASAYALGLPSAAQRPPAGTETPRPAVDFVAQSITVYEGQGVAKVDIVRRDAAHAGNVVWWTRDGSAHAGADYADFGPRVEAFAAGDAKRTLYIPLAADAVHEENETFTVHLDTGANLSRDDGMASIEIRVLDDD